MKRKKTSLSIDDAVRLISEERSTPGYFDRRRRQWVLPITPLTKQAIVKYLTQLKNNPR